MGLVALLLVACSSPQEQLGAALTATAAEPVAFTVEVDAGEEALARLGEVAEQASALLGGFRVTGGRAADGRLSAALELDVGLTAVEAIAEDDAVWLRSGLGELLGTGGTADEAERALAAAGVGPDSRAALAAGFTGDWIRLTLDDLGGLDPLRSLRGHLEVDEEVDGDEVEAEGVTRLEGRLDVDGWLASAAGGDAAADESAGREPLPVTIDLADGRLQRVEVALEDDAGERVAVTLTLSEHGEAEIPSPPDDAVAVDPEDLAAVRDLVPSG